MTNHPGYYYKRVPGDSRSWEIYHMLEWVGTITKLNWMHNGKSPSWVVNDLVRTDSFDDAFEACINLHKQKTKA